MHTTINEGVGGLDLLAHVTETVRKAIEFGLIKTVSLYEFDQSIDDLDGNELEDYLQDLWDNI